MIYSFGLGAEAVLLNVYYESAVDLLLPIWLHWILFSFSLVATVVIVYERRTLV
jgi:hypothetical protein